MGEVVITPRQKLEDLIRLAELCVDLLRQNEEFYAEVTLSSSALDTFSIQKSYRAPAIKMKINLQNLDMNPKDTMFITQCSQHITYLKCYYRVSTNFRAKDIRCV